MKLHLFSTSGTGVSTLGEAIYPALQAPYFDTDAYFWHASDPPFHSRCPPSAMPG
jgi:adenylate kinase family enzyme